MPVIYLTNMSSIEEAFEESGRQVALTSVSDNDDDRLSRKLWTSDYLTGSLQGPATGDTRDNALFCGSATGEGDGLITGNQQDPVNDGLVEVIRDKARAPALDLVRSLVTFSNDGGLGGLGTEDLDLGILLLEVLASARDGATGTDTGDDGVDLALGIVPDLLTSAIMMDRRISGVIELAGQDGTGGILDDLGSLAVGSWHAVSAWGEHQLGTQQTNDGAALLRHCLRHSDDDLVTASRTNQSQTDTCITGRGFNNRASRIELAGSLSRVNDRRSDTVLDARGRVIELELGQYGGLGVREQFIDLDQRGIADELGNVVSDLRHGDKFFRLTIR